MVEALKDQSSRRCIVCTTLAKSTDDMHSAVSMRASDRRLLSAALLRVSALWNEQGRRAQSASVVHLAWSVHVLPLPCEVLLKTTCLSVEKAARTRPPWPMPAAAANLE